MQKMMEAVGNSIQGPQRMLVSHGLQDEESYSDVSMQFLCLLKSLKLIVFFTASNGI